MNGGRLTPAEIRAQDNIYEDRFINLNIGLWNAIAAIDGLFISAAAIIVAVNPQLARWPFFLIIICSIVSLLGIIYNFYAARQTHDFLVATPDVDAMTGVEWAHHEQEAKNEVEKARRRHKNMRCSEKLCFGLLVVVISVFVYLVAQNKGSRNTALQVETLSLK
jgi:hypothetical protein